MSSQMYSVYLIQNTATEERYIGKTNDLQRRVREHNSGEQDATKRKNGKWNLIYAETFRSRQDADKRERKLKQHGSSKRWLFDRVENSLL